MKLAILIVSRNRPDLVDAMAARLAASVKAPYDLYVVECGTDPGKFSRHSSLWFADADFSGECYGQHLALQAALARGTYDYLWFLASGLVFAEGIDPAGKLIATLAREPRLAMLSPTFADAGAPVSQPRAGGGWSKAASCDHLGFMMKRAAIEAVGFLNPSLGPGRAMHELALRLESRGWCVGYADDVSCRHLGGETCLGVTESGSSDAGASNGGLVVPDGPLRLHLGCGPDYREGWVNVDTNPLARADLHCNVESLPAIRDGSARVVEACHVFEHLTLTQARAALREWRRVLRDDGELLLELPDLEACIRILGRETDAHGIDFGMMGMYGWPPDIDREGVPQIHKWGWTRAALAGELRDAGFDRVTFLDVTQTWRPATRLGRDMRVRASRVATKPARVENSTA